MPLSFAPTDNGILPDRMIAALAADGAICAKQPFAAGQIQPASLDLRLGAVAYRVRASFLPGPGTAVGLADRVSASLPAFAGRATDPRTPQNLAPVAGLESWLRRRMGDARMIRRSLLAHLTERT